MKVKIGVERGRRVGGVEKEEGVFQAEGRTRYKSLQATENLVPDAAGGQSQVMRMLKGHEV